MSNFTVIWISLKCKCVLQWCSGCSNPSPNFFRFFLKSEGIQRGRNKNNSIRCGGELRFYRMGLRYFQGGVEKYSVGVEKLQGGFKDFREWL